MTKRELPEAYSRKRLLSLKQAAEFLSVSVATLQRMIKRGELGPLIPIGLRRKGLRAGPLLDVVREREAGAREAKGGELLTRKIAAVPDRLNAKVTAEAAA
jgi:excisionase family DNA binding protein